MAHKAEQRRRFKAVLCAKPRTYSRIREERKRAEDQGIRMTASQFEEEEEKDVDQPVLDGYFLVKKKKKRGSFQPCSEYDGTPHLLFLPPTRKKKKSEMVSTLD